MNGLILKVIDESQMSADLDFRIRRALCLSFPADIEIFSNTRGWHGSQPAFSVVAESEGGEVMAHVGVVERRVQLGDSIVRVAGIQNVCVIPAQRGHGLSERCLLAATDEALKRGFDLGLLFCTCDLTPLYLRLNWNVVNGRRIHCWNDKGDEEDALGKNIAMVYLMKIQEIPQGDIHLQGPDW